MRPQFISKNKVLQAVKPARSRRYVGLTAQDCPDANQSCPLPADQPNCPVRFPGGEPICPAGNLGYRISYPTAGTYSIMPGLDITITTSDEIYFDWSATRPGVTSIVVKGGTTQYVYSYANKETSGTGLHSPSNPSGQCNIPQISHIDICINPDLVILFGLMVSKTANTAFKRTLTWTVVKTADTSSLILSEGQTALVLYRFDASHTHVDSDWEVYGTITIKNGNTQPGSSITIDDVNDLIPPAATVTLPVSLPYELAPGEELVATYVGDLAGPGAGINRVLVDASRGTVDHIFTAQANWDFSTTPREQIEFVDECAIIKDESIGYTSGGCSYDDNGFSASVQVAIGPFARCGEYEITNEAVIIADDTGAQSSDSWTIAVNVTCPENGGCTLTIGYWKTHSEYGPAPYDDTWALLPQGAATVFFFSGQTYYHVLKTAPAGNVYYILAHQFIAAELNQLNGTAIPAVVLTAYNSALALLNTAANTPTYINGLNGSNSLRKKFVELANTLEQYNSGKIGPGHCTE